MNGSWMSRKKSIEVEFDRFKAETKQRRKEKEKKRKKREAENLRSKFREK
jgi:hypothetical protein